MSGRDSPSARRIAEALGHRLGAAPDVLVVLGSGLGGFEAGLNQATSVAFTEIEGFPAPSVEGHAGRFIAGRVGGLRVLAQSGRLHAYEGHPLDRVALPVRVAAELGAGSLIVTNSAGGVNPELRPGDLVLLKDHVNLMFRSPLVGPLVPGEDRFPDMSRPYDSELRALAAAEARRLGLALRNGVYGAVLGPAYETAAEVRMLAGFGVDVVGMSTVPEVLVARARGMRCLGLSMVTNPATGLAGGPLTHEEVLQVAHEAGGRLATLLTGILDRWPADAVNRAR